MTFSLISFKGFSWNTNLQFKKNISFNIFYFLLYRLSNNSAKAGGAAQLWGFAKLNSFTNIQQSYLILTSYMNFCYNFSISGHEKWFGKYSLYYLCRSFIKHFKTKIKLIGLRYRILSVKEDISEFWINIGLSHFFGIDFFNNYMTVKRNLKRKHSLKFKSHNRDSLLRLLFAIRRFRGPNLFTGNGIRLLGEKIKLKPRRKAK